jgi:hypothetical protein
MAVLAGDRDAFDSGPVFVGTGARSTSARMEAVAQQLVRPRQDRVALSPSCGGSNPLAALRKTRHRLAILSHAGDEAAPSFLPLNPGVQSALKYWQADPEGCILYFQRGTCGSGRPWKYVWRGQQRQES